MNCKHWTLEESGVKAVIDTHVWSIRSSVWHSALRFGGTGEKAENVLELLGHIDLHLTPYHRHL